MPQISVIVPVYKVEPYLHRCVDSILNQSFTDFELILVDDGSPDGCPAICDEYAAQDSRVHVIHQQNGGLSAARNAGIDWAFANSDSRWLTLIDSDDWVHPMYLQALLSAAESENTAVSICMFQKTEGKDPDVDGSHLSARKWDAESIYAERNIYATIACGKLYRKSCFERIRYPVGKLHEDEFVTYRVLFEAEMAAMIDEPLYAYYVNHSGITKSQWRPQRLDSVEALKAQADFMKRNRYQKAFRFAIRKQAIDLANQITQLRECDTGIQKKYMPSLRSKLGRTLLCNTRHIRFAENQWLYDLAFTHAMQIYWAGKAQAEKILRKT